MEIAERVIYEMKDSAKNQQELRDQIEHLKGYLAIEEQNLAFIKSANEHAKTKYENVIKSVKSMEEQENFLVDTRKSNIQGMLRQVYYKGYAQKMEPDQEELTSAFHHLQDGYLKLISNYEKNSDYVQVLEAEATGKQLTQLIIEKRNELMRIEASENDD